MKTAEPFLYDAVVAGYIGVDITPGFPASRTPVPLSELLRPGKLIQTEGLDFSLGGVVANTGLALKRFGKQVALMGLAGNDALGDTVLNKLREHGVSSGIRRTDRAGTAYGIVLAPPGTDRMFLEDPGCNGIFTAADVDYETVAKSRLFHFGYPTLMQSLFVNNGAELQKLLARVREVGVATSLDMTLPDPDSSAGKVDWQSLLAGALPHVDIFVPSLEEILFLMDPKQYAHIISTTQGGDITDAVPPGFYASLSNRILALGVTVLMIKAGHRGAYLRTGDIGKLNAATSLRLADNWSHRELWIPAFPADPALIRNACGAGDCAVAGFLAAMLSGADIERTGRYAMMAGRDNLYGADALSGLSDWSTMTDRLQKPD